MKHKLLTAIFILFFIPVFSQQYKNFKVSVYCRAYEVAKMGDTTNYLKPKWEIISNQLKVDKVYLETHRDLLVVDQKALDMAKEFFKKRGIEIAGGITYTISEPNRFQTFCYNDPDDRKKVKEIAEFTAQNFDEFILDDFFFTNCKTLAAIKDKGTRSWTQYRLELMAEAGKNLVIDPAKKINPKVKVIIKYPNWYEHFQGLGFDLQKGPQIFDAIYSGTETRDARMSEQHLQPYLSYNIIRYFENIAPGRNGGGWVDPFGSFYTDRYEEQLCLTAFAKAREITLFSFAQLTDPIYPSMRAPWQGQNTSFDFFEMASQTGYISKTPINQITTARMAGHAFETADKAMGFVGKPIGIKSYRPYHSTGEDFLQNYLGMIGLPMDECAEFPTNENVILLTEEAKFDPTIVDKIKKQLLDGKTVVITSGLLRELQDKGIKDIAEIRYTDRKALVQDFSAGRGKLEHIETPILIQQLQYLTNDSWEIVSGVNGTNGWPILHEADYATGRLYVLVIPDNFADLYRLPTSALNKIREVLCGNLPVSIEGPGNIALFVYDNNTIIVESFLEEETQMKIVSSVQIKKITDLYTNQSISGEVKMANKSWTELNKQDKNVFTITLKPHSFRVFKLE